MLTAHPSDTSFNRALVQELKTTLQGEHEVTVRDLYRDLFHPVLTVQDLTPAGPTPDVTREQDLIRWAEMIVVVYPVWWTGMPAVLKGYFDRVFTYGFAYNFQDGQKRTLLDGKQAVLFSTTGAAKSTYELEGMYAAMNMTVDHGIFGYCGVKVLGHHYYSGIAGTTPEERGAMLQDARLQVRLASTTGPVLDADLMPV